MSNFTEQAITVAQAIKALAENSDRLNNFQLYLEYHFDTWLEKFASTPDGFTSELKNFSKINF